MTDYNKAFEANRKVWDALTKVHVNADFYDNEAFIKNPNSLRHIEQEELGSVAGKSMIHLQCHFGQDSISWAMKGARVVGLDLSPEAVAKGRELSHRVGADCTFVNGNVLDAGSMLKEGFDIVYTSYGTITWLPDIELWAEQVGQLLKAGGTFYMVDFHPIMWMFDEATGQIREPYFNPGIQAEKVSRSYTGDALDQEYTEYYWNHPISDILNALIKAGLRIDAFNEFDYSAYKLGDDFEEVGDQQFRIKKLGTNIPYMYSIKASK